MEEVKKCTRCRVLFRGESATCDYCRDYKREYREANREWLAYQQWRYRMRRPVKVASEPRPLKTHEDRLHERRSVSQLEALLSDALSNLSHDHLLQLDR